MNQMGKFDMDQLLEKQKDSNNSQQDQSERNKFLAKIYLGSCVGFFLLLIGDIIYQLTNYYFSYSPYTFFTVIPSIACQLYFEWLNKTEYNGIINYFIAFISIVSNGALNFYFLLQISTHGYYEIISSNAYDFVPFLSIWIVLLFFVLFGFYSTYSFNSNIVWFIMVYTPLTIQLIIQLIMGQYQFSIINNSTFVQISILIFMKFMTKQMQQKQNTNQELFIYQCSVFGVLSYSLIFILKLFFSLKNRNTLIYEANEKQKVSFIRKLTLMLFSIQYIVQITQIELYYQYGYPQNYNFSNFLIDFAYLFYIIILSLFFYVIIIVFHSRFNNIINLILSFLQIITYIALIFLVAQLIESSTYQHVNQYLYLVSYYQFSAIIIGLLIYSHTMKDEAFQKSQAITYMIICSFAVWILYIQQFCYYLLQLAYSLAISIFFCLYAIWIVFEIDWQQNKRSFQIKQYDYQIASIQVIQPIYAMIPRFLCLLFD